VRDVAGINKSEACRDNLLHWMMTAAIINFMLGSATHVSAEFLSIRCKEPVIVRRTATSANPRPEPAEISNQQYGSQRTIPQAALERQTEVCT
jgi:hypothetical protein